MTSASVEHDYYHTLQVAETATQQEIKQSYRRLAKQFHPDSQTADSGHEGITRLNAAYEILRDPQLRSTYDHQRQQQRTGGSSAAASDERAARTARSQAEYRQQRAAAKAADAGFELWVRQVYTPIDRLIAKILSPFKAQLRALSADPFDDELMEAFQTYLEDCRTALEKAQTRFQSAPNPSSAAAAAANLYYCLNQLEDGIEEMERYTYCYEESYLHTGQELFRIASRLRREAKAQLKASR